MSETVAEIAVTAENDEHEDDSMEKLQLDEEDENNISVEDLLGGKSLMMSDSEGEGGSEVSKVTEKNEATDENDNKEGEEEEALPCVPNKVKSISAVIDSDSEEEFKPKPKKKISALIDSDSDVDQEKIVVKQTDSLVPQQKKKISAIIDTDSEEEEKEEPHEQPQKEIKEQKRNKKLKQRSISDDEESNVKSPSQDKQNTLIDSESESDQSNDEEDAEDQEKSSDIPSEKPKKAKPMRASAKKALDGMQAIQSEQQRLHREAQISVPYHQPKPRTLKEFLNRRTINMPLATAMAGGSPMPNKQPRKSLGLRMTSDELEAYAKLMDEREKEATEFFKSESENEDEQMQPESEEPVNIKGNQGVGDEIVDKESNLQLDTEVVEEAMEKPIHEDEVLEKELAATETIITSPSKVCLITEVVELPKLDLSTLNITPPSKPATPKISEAIKRLKMEKSSDVSPSIKGDANMVIDLDTGDMFAKKPTGVDDLLQRLMKTREAKKHKTTETVNILSTEHGKVELSKVNIHLHDEEPVNKEQKPGAAYIKMQEQLKSLITKKRLEDLRKKKAEELEEGDEHDENDDEEGMDVDEEYEPEDKDEQTKIAINEDEEIVDEPEDAQEEEDHVEDVVDSDVDEEKEAEASSSSSSESENDTQTIKKKNRIIRPFQEDDNSDEEDDLLQTPKPNTTLAPMTATQLQLSAHKLFDTEVRRTASDEENELLDLCSGQFPRSQMSGTKETAADPLISQIPMTQFRASSEAPNELEGLCSGSFATQQPENEQEAKQNSLPMPEITTKILSSDEEEPKDTTRPETEKPRQKKLTKKRQKKKAKLGFSDDEDSDTDEDCDEEDDIGDQIEEVPETFVDYDSEENEVVVEMTKKDRKLRAANFVDKEAELSESEWGSADEDEKNMDNYDIELGDEDEFDREKLRNELEQIHARKMLDQDIREVRKIKEMLIEDDEGAVRQRQFRWKNAESGFSLEDQRNLENGATNEGSGDEENEHLWRKIRFEREQLLLEKGLKGTESLPAPLSPALNNATGSIRKLNIITAKKKTVETVKKSSPFLITKTVTSMQQKQQTKAVRGSFLVRDKETLTKLAGLTKGASGTDVDGTAGTVSVNISKAKNFVFATLTEEEHENQKRKAADLLNSSSETGINFMKKPRLEPRREKCLIDQLL
ncbi:claspin isoform X2 [Drosophila willistoni]|uniref:claspin isoform X2 n=1 Tax=Drosophila willistoni TaxID=7260 RepID=UPI00017D7F8D|nr:claspin isoform X2 [Drosophila willistoni]